MKNNGSNKKLWEASNCGFTRLTRYWENNVALLALPYTIVYFLPYLVFSGLKIYDRCAKSLPALIEIICAHCWTVWKNHYLCFVHGISRIIITNVMIHYWLYQKHYDYLQFTGDNLIIYLRKGQAALSLQIFEVPFLSKKQWEYGSRIS